MLMICHNIVWYAALTYTMCMKHPLRKDRIRIVVASTQACLYFRGVNLPGIEGSPRALGPTGPGRAYGQFPYYDSGFQRVWLKQNLNTMGWNSQVYGGFLGKFESANLSRDNLSKRLGVLLLLGVGVRPPRAARRPAFRPGLDLIITIIMMRLI